MYLLLANPLSGGGKGLKVKQEAIQCLYERSIEFRDISGSSFEGARANLRSELLNEDIDALILIGGDGMVHLAVQELATTKIPLLLLPAGTGNDFARACALDINSPLQNLEKAFQNAPRVIDLGRVNGTYFAVILSTGFDSVVNERANRMRMRSKRKYDLAMLLELPLFKPIRYELNVDGKQFSTEAMLIAIANGPSYGGGMLICPEADLFDSLFELMILEPVSKFELLRVFPKVFKGKHVGHPKVKFIKGREIRINALAVGYADGERIGSLPFEVKVVPKALNTWVYR